MKCHLCIPLEMKKHVSPRQANIRPKKPIAEHKQNFNGIYPPSLVHRPGLCPSLTSEAMFWEVMFTFQCACDKTFLASPAIQWGWLLAIFWLKTRLYQPPLVESDILLVSGHWGGWWGKIKYNINKNINKYIIQYCNSPKNLQLLQILGLYVYWLFFGCWCYFRMQ